MISTFDVFLLENDDSYYMKLANELLDQLKIYSDTVIARFLMPKKGHFRPEYNPNDSYFTIRYLRKFTGEISTNKIFKHRSDIPMKDLANILKQGLLSKECNPPGNGQPKDSEITPFTSSI